MFSKTRSINILFVVLLLVSLFVCYKFISKSHTKEINNLKDNNKKNIERINREHEEDLKTEVNIRDRIIIDKEGRIMELTEDNSELHWSIQKLKSYLDIKNKGKSLLQTIETAPAFTVTAYDLSVQSCGKLVTDRAYGITRNGTNLKGLDLRTASTISTDKSIIPLGSIVYLYFTEKKSQQFNGLYVSNDTGSAIKGKKIDLFFGDYNSTKPSIDALNFGRQKAKVIFLQ